MSAVVTLFGNLKDATDYNVTCKDAKVSFKASVGEVASIAIKTTSAQVNVKTPIEFSLLDATGIDVTPAKDIDSHCVVNVTGDYSSAEAGKPSEANITMANIGDEAEVEITYDSGVKGAENVTNKATIKCVKAEAVTGTTMFKKTKTVNAKSECAKFYLETPDTIVKVAEGATSDPVYFCATDNNTGDVISYDNYEAESSNDDVATVSVSTNSGKYAALTVTGNTTGTAQINITATKNGEASYYTIPVITTKAGVAVKMVVDADYRTMSDSSDSDYKNKITAKFYDADNNEIIGADKVTYTTEISNKASDGSEDSMLNDNVFTPGKDAKAKTYNITVKGQDLRSDKTFTSVIGVTVKKLPKEAWTTTGAAMTYQLEIKGKDGSKNLDEYTNNDYANVRVFATCNSLFAGYVDGNGAIAKGQIHANNSTEINSAKVAVKFGNEYYKAAELVSDNKSNKDEASKEIPAERVVKYVAKKANAGKYIVKANDNTTLAKTGSWTVEATLHYSKTNKDAVKTNTFTVKNSAKIPTVKVTTRNVDSLTFADIQKVLKTNVDMNNNNSDYDSIEGLEQKINNVDKLTAVGETVDATNSDGNKALVKNVVVVDGDWNFYVPVNTTFTVK